MSDRLLSLEQREAATKIAVKYGALQRCAACGCVSDKGDIDPEDPESLDPLVAVGLQAIGEDDELDVFDGDEDLRAALAAVIAEAPAEPTCSH